MLWLILIGTLLVVVALGREMMLFAWLPVQARLLIVQGKKPIAQQILERALTKPSLFGAGIKVPIRYRLVWLLMEQKRYEEAAEQCRTILQSRLKPAPEAEIRQLLAECLQGLGDPEGANRERQSATGLLQSAPEDALRYLAQARLLNQANRYEEACEAYQRGLALLPLADTRTRGLTMAQLALALFHAGRPADAVHWAEEALENDLDIDMAIGAHKAAGLGYSRQGDLEEAEAHYQQALTLAQKTNNRDLIGSSIAILALTQTKRGKLAEASAAAEQAAEMSLKTRRQARETQATCLRAWGRYSEAVEMLQQASKAPGHAAPTTEQRSQAVLALDIAWTEAEAERPEAAWNALQTAWPALRADALLNLYCLATEGWILALQGQAEEAKTRATQVEDALPHFAQDRSTQSICCARLARIAFLAGDPARSRVFWVRFLDLKPDPVWQPNGWYFLGECALTLGETEEAKVALRQALAVGVDTHYARLAQRLLARLEAPDGAMGSKES